MLWKSILIFFMWPKFVWDKVLHWKTTNFNSETSSQCCWFCTWLFSPCRAVTTTGCTFPNGKFANHNGYVHFSMNLTDKSLLIQSVLLILSKLVSYCHFYHILAWKMSMWDWRKDSSQKLILWKLIKKYNGLSFIFDFTRLLAFNLYISIMQYRFKMSYVHASRIQSTFSCNWLM